MKTYISLPGNVLLVILILLSTINPLRGQSIKGLYVNGFVDIIGDREAEDELLEFAHAHGFNYLLLYNLYAIHTRKFSITDEHEAKPLADFMSRARRRYGVYHFGAVGETVRSFDRMVKFNQLFQQEEAKFEVFSLEYEFWNQNKIDSYYCQTYLEDEGLPCDTSGAFVHFLSQLNQMKLNAQDAGAKAEVYIGRPTSNQAKQIGEIADRVLVHYYRQSDTYSDGRSIYNYLSDRLIDLAPQDGVLEIMPIFSAGSNFMAGWLESNDIQTVFDTYMNGQKGYNEDSGDWQSHIEVVGPQWYHFGLLWEVVGMPSPHNFPYIIPDRATVLPSPVDRKIKLRKKDAGWARLTLITEDGNIIWQKESITGTHITVTTKDVEEGKYIIILEEDSITRHFEIEIMH